MFNLTHDMLEANSAMQTAEEIAQQPNVWVKMTDMVFKQKSAWKEFVESIYAKHERVRVIMTGAGSSAFAGETLVPELRRQTGTHVTFEAVATTDIVATPKNYLFQNIPTIMVSFARSGNSPESLAAVSLGKQMVDHFYQVVITCNAEGQLAVNSKQDDNSLTILMPDEVNDQGFAMTSSFTSMMMTAYGVFTEKPFTGNEAKLLISTAEDFLATIPDKIDELLAFDFSRVVYLGSGLMSPLSHEAALKMLELTAGNAVAIHESSLGFRHGPKSILNDQSVVVLFVSSHAYTRKYDMDLLRELAADNSGSKVIALTEKPDEEADELADWAIYAHDSEESFSGDFQLAFTYILFAQLLAFRKSLQLGLTPDNPSPDGRVNRVVQGVTIYDYEQ
ncbi:SIS domain-containing protein [Barrientosiimonas marina]|uniref:SIS domain-containing protein n=1 Tax=Lentibacillus kimchii TaxID=1542911 RepID=A0ABW2UTX9_9BACI